MLNKAIIPQYFLLYKIQFKMHFETGVWKHAKFNHKTPQELIITAMSVTSFVSIKAFAVNITNLSLGTHVSSINMIHIILGSIIWEILPSYSAAL